MAGAAAAARRGCRMGRAVQCHPQRLPAFAVAMWAALALFMLLGCWTPVAAQHRYSAQTRGGDGVTRIMIATPVGSEASLTLTYTTSMLRTLQYFWKDRLADDIQLTWRTEVSGVVEHNRNMLVKHFLENEPLADYILFIDSDAGWPPYLIERMVRFGENVMAGIFPYKRFDWAAVAEAAKAGVPSEDLASAANTYVFNHFSYYRDAPAHLPSEHGFVEAPQVGMGFTMIHRSVFEAIADAYGPRLSVVYKDRSDGGADRYYRFFQFSTFQDNRGDNRWVGEDVFFLQLWASLGGKVWADVHRGLDHQGTHVWDGRHFPNSLQYTGGVAASQVRAVVDEVDEVATSHPHMRIEKGRVFERWGEEMGGGMGNKAEL